MKRIARTTVLVPLIFAWGVAAQQIPIADFFDESGGMDMKLSPDGNHLAMKFERHIEVWTTDTLTGVIQYKAPSDYDQRVADYWWISNDKVMFETWVARPEGPYYTSDFYVFQIDGKNSYVPYQRYRQPRDYPERRQWHVKVIDTLPSNKRRALVRAFTDQGGARRDLKPAIWELDINSRTESRMYKSQVSPLWDGMVYADRRGVLRLVNGRDENGRQSVLYRKDKNAPWIDINTSNWYGEGTLFAPLGFTGDGKTFFAFSDHMGTTVGLYRFVPDDNSLKEVFRDERYDLGFVRWNASNTAPISVTYEKSRPITQPLTAKSAEITVLQTLLRTFDPQFVSIIDASLDSRVFLARVWSDRNPGELYVFDREASSLKLVSKFNAKVKTAEMNDIGTAQLETPQGSAIDVYLTIPKSADNVPLVVLPHAEAHQTRDYWAYNSTVQAMASRGLAVLQVNYRGSIGYGHKFREAGYHQWGGLIIDDIIQATKWAKQQDGIDPNHVCIFGERFGAFAALTATARDPELYNCTIGHEGFYDLNGIWDSGFPDQIPGLAASMQREMGRDREMLALYSPHDKVDTFKGPLLLTRRSTADPISSDGTNKLHLQLQGSGVDYEVFIDDGGGFPDVLAYAIEFIKSVDPAS